MMGSNPQPDQIILRWLGVEQADDRDLDARCIEILSPDERSRHRRFRYERDRRLYLAAHTLLRATLSEFGHRPPEAWSFAVDKYGKPHVVPDNGCPPLHFNLTHTAGFTACVVSAEHEVGLDAERLDRKTVSGLADRFFSPVERAQLEELSGNAWQRAFFDIWTLKEAYIKGRGIGVSLPLRSFGFTLPEDDREKIHFSPPLGDLANRWSFFRLRPGPHHTLAVAVNHPQGIEPLLISSRSVPLSDLL